MAGKAIQAALVAVVLAAALAAAGCGGSSSKSGSDSTMSASAWAEDLCKALGTWSSSVRSATSSLSGHPDKQSLQKAGQQMKDATSQLESDLKGLKRPDTDAGAKAKQSIDTLATQLKDDLTKLEDAVKSADKNGGTVQAVSAIGSTLTTLSGQVRTAFTNLQQVDAKGKLESAFKGAPSCKKLAG